MEPSKPNDPDVDRGQAIPRSRPSGDEVLEGEIVGKDVPLGRPRRTPPPTPPKSRKINGRIVLLIVLASASLICLVGSITAYTLYKNATEPDRSTPEGVLEQYIDAKFNSRNEARAKLFECPSSDLAAIDETLNGVKALEDRFSISVTVKPAAFAVSVNGSQADVQSTLKVIIPEVNGGQSSSEQVWEFHLTKDRTWRLCKAVRRS